MRLCNTCITVMFVHKDHCKFAMLLLCGIITRQKNWKPIVKRLLPQQPQKLHIHTQYKQNPALGNHQKEK